MTYGGPPAERQQGRVARQAEEQRDAQGQPEEREGHERHDLSGIGLPARVEAERQRRAETPAVERAAACGIASPACPSRSSA